MLFAIKAADIVHFARRHNTFTFPRTKISVQRLNRAGCVVAGCCRRRKTQNFLRARYNNYTATHSDTHTPIIVLLLQL